MADIGVACATCPAFLPEDGDQSKGICRHNPPHPFLVPGPPHPLNPNQPNLRIQAVWPPVLASHWCAQHKDFKMAAPIDQRLAADADGRA